MKIKDFNLTYEARKYQLEIRHDKTGQCYLRLLDYAQEKEVTQFPFPDPTADLPVTFLEYVKTLPDGDLSI